MMKLNEAFQIYYSFLNFTFVQSANRWINRLKTMPLLGSIVPITMYQQYDAKNSFMMILLICQLFMGIIWKIIAIVPLMILVKLKDIIKLVHISPLYEFTVVDWSRLAYWWLLFIGLSRLFTLVFKKSYPMELRDYTIYFQLERQMVWQNYLRIELFHQCILHLIPLWIIALMANQRLLFILCITGYIMSFIVHQRMIRKLYQHQFSLKIRLIYWGVTVLIAFSIGFTVNHLPVKLLNSPTLILIVIFIFIMIAVGIFYKKREFTQEREFYRVMIENLYESDSDIQEATKIIQNIDVIEATTIQDKMVIDRTKNFENLKGQAYLNAVLFDRYHRVFKQKIKWRLLGSGMMALLFNVGIFLYQYWSEVSFNELQKIVIVVLPLVFLAMYAFSLGKVVVKVCFVNCDLAMLNYPFYRDKHTILSGFNNRLWRIVQLNFSSSLMFMLGYLLLAILQPALLNLGTLWIILFMIMCMHLLLSFHELFLYYLLQPFSRELKIQSFLYRVLHNFTYFLFLNFDDVYLLLDMQGVFYFSIGLLVYIFIGYGIIMLMAPKTFRLKD